MTVTTVEVDQSVFPGADGAYHTIVTFPIRSGVASLTFVIHNTGDRNTAARYHMELGSPTSFLTSGFNTAAGATDTRTYTTTLSGPLSNWSACRVDLGGDAGFVGQVHVHVEQVWSGVPGVACPYGTQLTDPGTLVYYLTPGLIDIWLGAIGAPWLAPFFTALWFTYMRADVLCGSAPPDVTHIVIQQNGLPSVNDALTLLESIAWQSLCQCVPGSPAPTPEPPPTLVQPPGWLTTPVITCSNADLCALLTQVQQLLQAIAMTTSEDLTLTTLVQRQLAPFAYVPGPVHAGLTGAGAISVAGVVGVKIDITTLPGTLGVEGTSPPKHFDCGFVTFGTIDGFQQAFRVERNPQVLFPDRASVFTDLDYDLAPGVVVTITELVREP
jgi:hypothetical protein